MHHSKAFQDILHSTVVKNLRWWLQNRPWIFIFETLFDHLL